MNITATETINAVKRNMKQKLFSDSIYSLTGTVLGRGSLLIVGILVARILGEESFSEYSIVKENITYVGLLGAFGFGYSSTQTIAKYAQKQSILQFPLLQSIYIISFVIIGLCTIAICLFSKKWINVLELTLSQKMFIFASLGIVFNGINNVQTGILSGFKDFKSLAQNMTISGIVTIAVSIPLCNKYKLAGGLIGLLFSYLFLALLNAISIKKTTRCFQKPKYSYKHTRKIIQALFKLSLPIALNENLYMILHWAGIILLIKLYTKNDVGLFNAAIIWNSTILFIPGALRSVGLSHLSSNSMESRKNTKILFILIGTNICAIFSPFIFVLLFANFITSFYGSTYEGLNSVLRILICTTFFQCISVVLSQELIALKKNWLLLFSSTIRDCGIIVLTIILFLINVNLRGAIVFSIATLFMNIIYFVLLFVIVYYSIKSQKINGLNA